ncbi:MAG TPA: hypothetical protein VL769_08335 [Acidimicrobiia bacterium]|nr:hypothetical protein [Acidimicrobiia bacterium]
MLWFERQVVGALMSSTLDDRARVAVESYVNDTLASMPEHLRAGVLAESLLFGARPRLAHALGRSDDARLPARIERWRTSRIDFVRQYVRLLHSLVLFGENELAPSTARGPI